MVDLRFPTALQIVLSLAVAQEGGILCTSEVLAAGLGANPSLVRRILVGLNDRGVTVAVLGRKGGVQLARPADQITLRDVYLAIGEKPALVARPGVPAMCVISSNIGTLVDTLAAELDAAVLAVLGRRTVAASLTEVRNLAEAGTSLNGPQSMAS